MEDERNEGEIKYAKLIEQYESAISSLRHCLTGLDPLEEGIEFDQVRSDLRTLMTRHEGFVDTYKHWHSGRVNNY